MKNILSVIFILLFALPVFSQQDPQYTHNMFNHMSINPGSAGKTGKICATAINRQQWVGFDGAPTTTMFTLSAGLDIFKVKSGLGLIVVQDEIGFDKNFNLKLAYAYQTELSVGKIGIGIDFGLINKALEPEWKIPSGEDFTPPTGDPAIPENENDMAFDMAIGVFYSSNNFYAGLSSSHLNQAQFQFEQSTIPYMKRHYYLTTGYITQTPISLLELQPSLFAKFDGTTTQFDLNALAIYNKKVWGGFTYRLGDAIGVMAGIELFNGIKIGYAYELPTTKIIKYSGGTHEVFLNYCFTLDFAKGPQRYESVRYLK